MPLVDKPLDQLKEYYGISPKPADFDDFWDRSIAEMKALDPQIEMIPSDFQFPYAECIDLYWTGIHGARIHAKLLRPKGQTEPGPGLVKLHGYSGDAGGWMDHGSYAAAGFTVASIDCRGQGGKSEDVGGVKGNTLNGHIIRGLDGPPEKMLFREIFLDCAQLAGIVIDMETVDETRVGAHGGSQGGALTFATAALEPRIKRAVPVYPFLSDYRRVWEMDLAANAYRELKEYFRHFDPRHEREDEIFTKLGYIDIQHLAPRIQAEVLMGVGLMDNICPPSTQFAAFNKIPGKKDLAIYPDFGHEGLPDFNEMTFDFLSGM